jgi:hypothetical protein
MKYLLQIEWLKIRNYRTFLVIAIFYVLGIFTSNYIVYTANKNIGDTVNSTGLISSWQPYGFDLTWQTTSYVTGFLLILPVLLLIILITNEFTYRTNRQNVIDGLSRKQFIEVKLCMALIIALISTVLVFITALLFASFSGTSFSISKISGVGYFFLKALSYNLLAVMISVWVRRTGFAIGIFFIYMGAENIISQLLNFWSVKIRTDTGWDLGSLGDYLPMNAVDSLLSFPDNPVKSMTKSAFSTDYIWLSAVFAVAYLVFFFWFSRRLYLKKDL